MPERKRFFFIEAFPRALSRRFFNASGHRCESEVQSLGFKHFSEKKTRKALSPLLRLEQRPRGKMKTVQGRAGLKALQRYLLIKSWLNPFRRRLMNVKSCGATACAIETIPVVQESCICTLIYIVYIHLYKLVMYLYTNIHCLYPLICIHWSCKRLFTFPAVVDADSLAGLRPANLFIHSQTD